MQTNSTVLLTKAALWGLRKIYRKGYRYQKAGVMLSDFVTEDNVQTDLFGTGLWGNKQVKLMEIIDKVNDRMGNGTIRLASEGIHQAWLMRRGNKSQNYTTDWNELICVK